MLPPFMTTIVSDMVSASSWKLPWVTKINVMPDFLLDIFQLALHFLAQLEYTRAPSGS